jgi:hypothetical protein
MPPKKPDDKKKTPQQIRQLKQQQLDKLQSKPRTKENLQKIKK